VLVRFHGLAEPTFRFSKLVLPEEIPGLLRKRKLILFLALKILPDPESYDEYKTNYDYAAQLFD
jgi:hypothetical protein